MSNAFSRSSRQVSQIPSSPFISQVRLSVPQDTQVTNFGFRTSWGFLEVFTSSDLDEQRTFTALPRLHVVSALEPLQILVGVAH